jgi:hypothetical protein
MPPQTYNFSGHIPLATYIHTSPNIATDTIRDYTTGWRQRYVAEIELFFGGVIFLSIGRFPEEASCLQKFL